MRACVLKMMFFFVGLDRDLSKHLGRLRKIRVTQALKRLVRRPRASRGVPTVAAAAAASVVGRRITASINSAFARWVPAHSCCPMRHEDSGILLPADEPDLAITHVVPGSDDDLVITHVVPGNVFVIDD